MVEDIRRRQVELSQLECMIRSQYGDATLLSSVPSKPVQPPAMESKRRKHRTKLTTAQMEEMQRLYAAGGIGYQRLGARFDVSTSTVRVILRRDNTHGHTSETE